MGGGRCGEGLSATNDKESVCNKEIFADAVTETLVDDSASPLNEFHGHKALTLETDLMPSQDEDEDDDDLPEYDWEEHTSRHLERLLNNNMMSIFQTAINRVVECGYSEVAAGWAVLNSGLSRGDKDVVSNIVDGAVNLLKTQKEFDVPKKPVYDGLRSLVEYFVLEMTNVILETRPELTIADAMRCLLKSDMNLARACLCPVEEVASGTSHPVGQKPMPSGCSNTTPIPISMPPLYPPNFTSPYPAGKKSPINLKEMRDQLCHARDQFQVSAQAAGATINDNRGIGKKAKPKKDKSRLKGILLEKERKDQGSPEAFRAKFNALGNMVLEKTLKSQTNLLSKINGSKTNAPPPPAFSVKGDASAPVEAKSTGSPKDPRLKAKTTHVPGKPLKGIDYYAGIPYDETLKKHVPQDEKDKEILALVPYKQELEKKLQYWGEWAKEKVMEATKRLAQDQGELKKLRQEKEERLKDENSSLSTKMGTCNLRATQAHQYLEEAVEREQDAIRKCQLSDAEKGVYLDQLDSAKIEVAEMNSRVEKMKEQQNQVQVLLRKEEKEKLKVIAKLEFLISKKEEDEALAKVEAESIIHMAEMNIKKTKEEIKKLEKMNSDLILKAERSKIAALKIGYGSCPSPSTAGGSDNDDFFTFRAFEAPSLAAPQNNLGRGRARECIMCMNEEISVVFMPCAHQVLCVECSILHRKQGMNGCPSCRTTIHHRIQVKHRPL
ncbi:hypothetical protein F511_26410 [Dorcoceras hygrometricum]|uniref:RING-type domain-containing protein n=1 Tax=Dorcoceras hygrometricum TaxID=472368 RepID=A0A2Z7CAR2_9LAMI|nr:hypothetical protein F511_26410 [Dorcoceras hygrometricum]